MRHLNKPRETNEESSGTGAGDTDRQPPWARRKDATGNQLGQAEHACNGAHDTHAEWAHATHAKWAHDTHAKWAHDASQMDTSTARACKGTHTHHKHTHTHLAATNVPLPQIHSACYMP